LDGFLYQAQGLNLQQGRMRGGKWVMFLINFNGFQRIGKLVIKRIKRGKLNRMPSPGA